MADLLTAGAIFDAIQAAPVSGLLGTVLVDGESEPGLLVASEGEAIPGLAGAQGAVVVVVRSPQIQSEPTLNGGAIVSRSFTLRVLQFGTGPGSFDEVVAALVEQFPGASAATIGGPPSLAGHGQAVIRLPRAISGT
jgi:hypothetical protein